MDLKTVAIEMLKKKNQHKAKHWAWFPKEKWLKYFIHPYPSNFCNNWPISAKSDKQTVVSKRHSCYKSFMKLGTYMEKTDIVLFLYQGKIAAWTQPLLDTRETATGGYYKCLSQRSVSSERHQLTKHLRVQPQAMSFVSFSADRRRCYMWECQDSLKLLISDFLPQPKAASQTDIFFPHCKYGFELNTDMWVA